MATSLFYQQPQFYNYGKPLIVLIETDPWAMLIGADIPSFALFDTGQVIYNKIENKEIKYYEVVLSKTELQKVINSLGITESLYNLPDHTIYASEVSDQPSNKLTLNLDRSKMVNVYGSLNWEEVKKNTPSSFLTVYDNIKKYENKLAKEWLPDKIEVMFSRYDNALYERPWINRFPDLQSWTTIKMDKNRYSVYIDKKDFDEFKKYYSSMREREAVKINGKKMSINYRLTFPNFKIDKPL